MQLWPLIHHFPTSDIDVEQATLIHTPGQFHRRQPGRRVYRNRVLTTKTAF